MDPTRRTSRWKSFTTWSQESSYRIIDVLKNLAGMTDLEADFNGSIASSAYGSASLPYETNSHTGRKVSMPIDMRSSRLVRDSITSFVTLGGRELSDEVTRLRLMVGTLSSLTLNTMDYLTRFTTKAKIIGVASRNVWAKLQKDNSNTELILDYFPIIRDYHKILSQHACHNKSIDRSTKKKNSLNNNLPETKQKLSETDYYASRIRTISADLEHDDVFHIDCGDSSTQDSLSDANSDNVENIRGRIDDFMDMIGTLEERLLVSSIRSKSLHNINLIKAKSQREARRAKRRTIIIVSILSLVGIVLAAMIMLLLVYVFKLPLF